MELGKIRESFDHKSFGIQLLKILAALIGFSGLYDQVESQRFSFFYSLFSLCMIVPICLPYRERFLQRESRREAIAETSIAEEIEFTAYKILDTQVHRYSSTHVGSIDKEVTSHVSFHSDQQIWGLNLTTNKEEMLEFDSANVPVRPDHIVVFAYNRRLKKYELARNVTTDSDWRLETKGSTSAALEPMFMHVVSLITAGLAAIPYIGALVQSLIIASVAFGKTGMLHDASGIHKRFYACVLWLFNPIYLFVLWHAPSRRHGEVANEMKIYIGATIIIAILHSFAVFDERKQAITRGRCMKEKLNQFCAKTSKGL